MWRSVVGLGSGSSVGEAKGHLMTEADSVYLRKFACWTCGNLRYCPRCKKFECVLGFPLRTGVCRSRKVAGVG